MDAEENKKTKKLLIVPGFYLPHIGGVETHIDEFSKYLSRRDYKITIFAPNIPETKDFELKYSGVKIIRYPAFILVPRNPLPKFWSPEFWGQVKKIIESNPDIVMTRTRFYFSTLFSFMFAKIFRKKFIHVEHGSDFLNTGTKFWDSVSKIYDLIFGKFIINHSDKVIAISNVSRKFLKENLKINKEIPVIRRGVDFEKYGGIAAANLTGKYMHKIFICYFGRLRYWKGVENSIKAVKLLDEKYKNKILFIIIGEGEEEKKLKKLAENEPVIFMGGVTEEEGISILKSCDIYIHSSYPGGALSNSLLQAMYCKCAVIATRNEGADEVINDNETGIFVDTKPEDIENKLVILTDDEKLREKLSNNAREFIKKEFSWEENVNEYVKIFNELN